jgi:uncharacterized protein (TIGR01777 family)
MSGERIILAGGSGFIGTLLARDLAAVGYEVIILSRDAARSGSGTPTGALRQCTALQWDGRTLGPWAKSLEGALAVVNLAGRSVNCHHNEKNRHEIIASRVNSVRVLGEAIQSCRQAPAVWVQAGGEGIYGDDGEGCCDESTAPGKGFLVETCQLWERAFNEATTPGTRHVLLRIGFVLGAKGGALKILGTLTKFGLGGTAGTGRQFINWIHEADLSRIIRAAIEQEAFTGVFNASGPNPVTNREFMGELRRVLRRPWSPPAPAWVVRLGAWLMGSDGRLALTGRCCVPKRLLDEGFTFQFPELAGALAQIYGVRRL